MKNILHIPAWFPSTQDPISGIYIKSLVESIAKVNISYNHYVWLYQHTAVQISISKSKDTIKNIVNEIDYGDNQFININYIICDKILALSPRLGGNIIDRITRNLDIKITKLNFFPDLVHVHVSYPGLAMAESIKRKYNCRILLTEHSSRFPDERFLVYGYDLNNLLNTVDKITTVSNYLRNKFITNNVEVIPNFIDSISIENVEKNKYFEFLVITRMEDERKRLDLILDAFSFVLKEHVNITLSIIGGGDQTYYRDYAKKLNIDHTVTWHGIQLGLEKDIIISRCHCLLVASDVETFSISTIEAHSKGLPVIATKCGGVEELIDDSNGILIEKGSAEQLKKAMIYLIENYTKFDSFQIAKDARERFCKNTITTRYLDLYQELMDR